jgi:hypothetical protein
MAGETTGAVRWILRLEGICVLAAAIFFIQHLILAGDVSHCTFLRPIFLCLDMRSDHVLVPSLTTRRILMPALLFASSPGSCSRYQYSLVQV